METFKKGKLEKAAMKNYLIFSNLDLGILCHLMYAFNWCTDHFCGFIENRNDTRWRLVFIDSKWCMFCLLLSFSKHPKFTGGNTFGQSLKEHSGSVILNY